MLGFPFDLFPPPLCAKRDTLLLTNKMTDVSEKLDAISVSNDPEQAADNWSGLSDPTERRRRQNRINQRAYRRLIP